MLNALEREQFGPGKDGGGGDHDVHAGAAFGTGEVEKIAGESGGFLLSWVLTSDQPLPISQPLSDFSAACCSHRQQAERSFSASALVARCKSKAAILCQSAGFCGLPFIEGDAVVDDFLHDSEWCRLGFLHLSRGANQKVFGEGGFELAQDHARVH